MVELFGRKARQTVTKQRRQKGPGDGVRDGQRAVAQFFEDRGQRHGPGADDVVDALSPTIPAITTRSPSSCPPGLSSISPYTNRNAPNNIARTEDIILLLFIVGFGAVFVKSSNDILVVRIIGFSTSAIG